jgi:hypothetical protein
MEGLAVGTERFSTALIGALGVAIVLLYLRLTAFGGRYRFDAVLTLQVTGDLAAGRSALKAILRCHSSRAHLLAERRQPDARLDLSYRLLLRDPARGEELTSALERNDGFENVSLSMQEDESEI